MSNTIECTRMSHPVCQDLDLQLGPGEGEAARFQRSPEIRGPAIDGYDCINDCVSSLGVVTLLESSIVALGCYAVPPACPVFVGAAAGAVLGGCDAACDELHPRKAEGK